MGFKRTGCCFLNTVCEKEEESFVGGILEEVGVVGRALAFWGWCVRARDVSRELEGRTFGLFGVFVWIFCLG